MQQNIKVIQKQGQTSKMHSDGIWNWTQHMSRFGFGSSWGTGSNRGNGLNFSATTHWSLDPLTFYFWTPDRSLCFFKGFELITQFWTRSCLCSAKRIMSSQHMGSNKNYIPMPLRGTVYANPIQSSGLIE
jgi:hypothetical protein